MTAALAQLPAFARVAFAQFRLLRTARGMGSLALMVIAAYTVAALGIVSFEVAGAPVFRTYPLLLIVSAAWAVIVWNDHDSSRRDYFWALPVGRSTHALARSLAGAAYLLLGLLLLALLRLMAGAITGTAAGSASALAWLSLFTGPLTVYLFVSAAALLSAYPGRWAIGAVIGWILLHKACGERYLCPPTVGGRSVIAELFGLVPAVTEVLRGEFVTREPRSPALALLMAAWLAGGVAAVALAASRPARI